MKSASPGAALNDIASANRWSDQQMQDGQAPAHPKFRPRTRPWRPNPEPLAYAVLDSMAAHVAVLDEFGTILLVNRAWRDFSRHNGAEDRNTCEGANYLRICDMVEGADAQEAAECAEGIRDVLAGRVDEFKMEYPCHSSSSRRWFIVRVARLHEYGPRRVVVTHEDITDRVENTTEIQRLNDYLEHRIRQLTALRRIDKAIVATPDQRLSLGVVLQQVVEQLGVDAANIILCSAGREKMECIASRGLPASVVGSSCPPLQESAVGQAARERRLLYVPDLRLAARDQPRAAELAELGFVFGAAVPIACQHNVRGFLEVFSRNEPNIDADWCEFMEMLAGQASIAFDSAASFDRLRRVNAELTAAYDMTIEGWSRALDMRDRETTGHSQRVSEMTVRLATAMGVSGEDLVHIRRGALLHDIGKMGIPDSILKKPGPLTDDEWEIMKKHPKYAIDMLSSIVFIKPALEIPSCHHEKWDGTGYPKMLKGEEIPLAARIFAAVDIWDALGHDRPYHKAWPVGQILEHIRSLSGTHLDPRVVESFLPLISPVQNHGELISGSPVSPGPV